MVSASPLWMTPALAVVPPMSNAIESGRPSWAQIACPLRETISTSSLPDEWRTLIRLAAAAAGQGPDVDVEAFDELLADADDPDLAAELDRSADDLERDLEKLELPQPEAAQ